MLSALALPIANEQPSWLTDDPYIAYSYSYPHKSAYGPLVPAVPLGPLWQAEDRRALFLYWHVPFCEMRCGFCNLFARAGADSVLVESYLDALERQAYVLAEATAGSRAIARLAVGGGTPTFLSARQLERLFHLADRYFVAHPSRVPTSIEVSPKTATPERLAVLRDHGVERVSIGVQSFLDEETRAIGRPQTVGEVHAALERLRDFPVLNIDLIYGQPGQTVASWLASLEAALQYRPEEIYLYPLYVRPNTGLGRQSHARRSPGSMTRRLYREARDRLVSEGYEQISMRFFQATNSCPSGPVYCCQTDGMIGLGCGARSYTSRLHYSSRFAVDALGVQAILDKWMAQTDTEFGQATWGIHLSEDERRRRFVIQSLLTRTGLEEAAYRRVFGSDVTSAFPELHLLASHGLLAHEGGTWRLTELGFEYADAVGPSFYSGACRAHLEAFTWS